MIDEILILSSELKFEFNQSDVWSDIPLTTTPAVLSYFNLEKGKTKSCTAYLERN